MSYSTPAMVRMALVPSSNGTLPANLSHTAADLTDSQLNDAIKEADSIIDGYLATIYVTPVAMVASVYPHPVDYWSRDIAAYLATCTYRGTQDITSTDPISLRYNAVLSMLKDVAAGRMVLPLPRNGADNGGTGAAGAPYNPYIGDLWTPEDFSIHPVRGDWPGWWNGRWS